jgi:hypothetical protein
MNNSSDNEKKNLSNPSQSSYTEGDWEISLKPSMTEEEKKILERLRRERDLRDQIPEEERIPISHPDKYSVSD